MTLWPNTLAQSIIVVSTLTFQEQNLHTLRHIDSQKHVRVAEQRRAGSQQGSLKNSIIRQVFLPERLSPEIPFDDKGAVEAAEDAEEDEDDDFEEVPGPVVTDGEHNQLACSKRVHCL